MFFSISLFFHDDDDDEIKKTPDCLLPIHLPKASSLGNGLMNAHQPINGTKSKSTALVPTTATTYHQRPLGSSKTTNGHHPQYSSHSNNSNNSSTKNGLTNGHYHHGSSGALSSLDKGRGDDLTSALTMSTAIGNWGWGFGPGKNFIRIFRFSY